MCVCVCEDSLLWFLNDKIRHSYLYWVLCIVREMGKGIHNHISLTFCGSTKRKKKRHMRDLNHVCRINLRFVRRKKRTPSGSEPRSTCIVHTFGAAILTARPTVERCREVWGTYTVATILPMSQKKRREFSSLC